MGKNSPAAVSQLTAQTDT